MDNPFPIRMPTIEHLTGPYPKVKLEFHVPSVSPKDPRPVGVTISIEYVQIHEAADEDRDPTEPQTEILNAGGEGSTSVVVRELIEEAWLTARNQARIIQLSLRKGDPHDG